MKGVPMEEKARAWWTQQAIDMSGYTSALTWAVERDADAEATLLALLREVRDAERERAKRIVREVAHQSWMGGTTSYPEVLRRLDEDTP